MRNSLLRTSFLILIAVDAAIAISYLGLWMMAVTQGLLWRADFTAFYTAWAMVRDGFGPLLYDLELQKSYQLAILGDRSFLSGLLSFNNPPHIALFFMFLSYLSLQQAYFVWAIGQIGLLLWLVRMLAKVTSHWARKERVTLLVTLIAFTPLMETFLKGTLSLFLLCCLTAFYISLKSGKYFPVGLSMVLASIKPQSLVLPGIVLLAGNQWKSILVAVGSGFMIVLMTSLFWGWNLWLDFFKLLLTMGNQPDWPGVVLTEMHNLKGLLTTLFGTNYFELISLSSLGIMILAAIYTIYVWRGKWQIQQPQFDLKIAATLSLGLFTSLHFNSHDSLQSVLPAVLLYNHLRVKLKPKYVFGFFALSAPIIFFVSSFASVGGNILPTLYLITIFLWSAWELHHAKEKS